MRAFVAAWPDATATSALGALARPATDGVRWTPPHAWHVTLRFLGQLPDDDMPEVVDALRAGLAGVAAVDAVLGPATARFGPHVLHVPVAGLDEVGAAVRAATRPFGDARDERPFVGHLTVARARRRGRVPTSLAGSPVSATWRVGEVALVSSSLGAGGARYRSEATVPLTG